MSDKTKLFLGISLIIVGQLLTFNLWFDGQNINGANDFSNIVLLSSLVFGLVLIIKSFKPSSFDIYIYFMAIPALIYFSYPKFMSVYKSNKFNGLTTTTNAIIIKIGEHKYSRRQTEKYYEFQANINNKTIIKFNENVLHIADWKLNTGDTIKIRYCLDDVNLIEVVEKK